MSLAGHGQFVRPRWNGSDATRPQPALLHGQHLHFLQESDHIRLLLVWHLICWHMACRMPAVIDTLTIDVITYAHHCGFVPLNALAYTLTTDELGILFICLQLELIHSIPSPDLLHHHAKTPRFEQIYDL